MTMTSFARNRTNMVLALAIPAAGFLYLTSGNSHMNVGVTLGLGALWLATVVALNAPPRQHVNRWNRTGRELPDLEHDAVPPRVVRPAYVVDVSEPVQPWRWTSVLMAPFELLAVAWSVPIIILLIMLPIGLAMASALWLGRVIVARF